MINILKRDKDQIRSGNITQLKNTLQEELNDISKRWIGRPISEIEKLQGEAKAYTDIIRLLSD